MNREYIDVNLNGFEGAKIYGFENKSPNYRVEKKELKKNVYKQENSYSQFLYLNSLSDSLELSFRLNEERLNSRPLYNTAFIGKDLNIKEITNKLESLNNKKEIVIINDLKDAPFYICNGDIICLIHETFLFANKKDCYDEKTERLILSLTEVINSEDMYSGIDLTKLDDSTPMINKIMIKTYNLINKQDISDIKDFNLDYFEGDNKEIFELFKYFSSTLYNLKNEYKLNKHYIFKLESKYDRIAATYFMQNTSNIIDYKGDKRNFFKPDDWEAIKEYRPERFKKTILFVDFDDFYIPYIGIRAAACIAPVLYNVFINEKSFKNDVYTKEFFATILTNSCLKISKKENNKLFNYIYEKTFKLEEELLFEVKEYQKKWFDIR